MPWTCIIECESFYASYINCLHSVKQPSRSFHLFNIYSNMQVKHRFSHWCVARASCCLQMGMHSYTFYFMTNLFVNQFSELGRLSLQKSDKVTICVLIRAVILKLSRFLRVRALKFNTTGVVFSSFNRQNKKSKYTNDSQSKQLKNSRTQTRLGVLKTKVYIKTRSCCIQLPLLGSSVKLVCMSECSL